MTAMESELAERIRLAFDLFEEGCDLMLQNLRRRHPSESEEELLGRLGEWLRARDGEHPGRPYSFRYPAP